jgi:hypothetical protein
MQTNKKWFNSRERECNGIRPFWSGEADKFQNLEQITEKKFDKFHKTAKVKKVSFV